MCFSGDSPTCWYHSLTLSYASENSEHPKSTTSVFSTHHGKFLYLFFISIHDRTLLIIMLSLTCPNMTIDNVNTQTIFVVLFTSGSLLTWGKPLDILSSVSPRYLSTTYSQLNYIPIPLQTSYHDRLCLLLSGVRQMGEGDGSAVGKPHHLPPTTTVPHTLYNSSGTVLPYQPQGLGGETENLPWHCLPVNTSWGGSHRGQEIWSIDHMGEPLSAMACSMEEAVRELTAWVSSGSHCPYTLVQLYKDTHHVPLPKEGHLGILH